MRNHFVTRSFLVISLLLLAGTAWGQVHIAPADTITARPAPNASAMLEVTAADRGVLIPRLTSTERDAITSPATSLLIYNKTEACMQINLGTPATPDWKCLTAGTGTDVDEWVDGDSISIAGLVYARQALANGDTVVVTDTGNIGVGISTPTQGVHSYNKSGMRSTQTDMAIFSGFTTQNDRPAQTGTVARNIFVANTSTQPRQLGNIWFEAVDITDATRLSKFKIHAQVGGSDQAIISGLGRDIGIGLNNAETPSNRLHIKMNGAAAGADPLRLEGLRDSVAATNKLLVADANGVVYEAAVADVLAASDVDEWVDGDSISIAGLVYARQALANGDTVVVTDEGGLLIGTTEEQAALTVIENDHIDNNGNIVRIASENAPSPAPWEGLSSIVVDGSAMERSSVAQGTDFATPLTVWGYVDSAYHGNGATGRSSILRITADNPNDYPWGFTGNLTSVQDLGSGLRGPGYVGVANFNNYAINGSNYTNAEIRVADFDFYHDNNSPAVPSTLARLKGIEIDLHDQGSDSATNITQYIQGLNIAGFGSKFGSSPLNIGLNIGNITNATNNYAIRTGTGTVLFRDSTAIGSFGATDQPTNTLHVSDTQDPLRLEGLRDSIAATNKLLVADANGVVYEAAVADVLAASDVDEWVDGDSIGIAGMVYARQAMDTSIDGIADTVVVTDNGRLGVGVSNPEFTIDLGRVNPHSGYDRNIRSGSMTLERYTPFKFINGII